jgi:GR25 family glycosyltransferase involved in LPS biosynthesis
MKLNVDKVFICHYSKLVDRKSDLVEHLNSVGVDDYEFVELYDKDTWNKEEIEQKYPLIFKNRPNEGPMKDSEASLCLKHVWAIEEVYKNDYESVLVFEDDVILCDDFVTKFNNFKEQLPDNWDTVWVGSCYNLHENYIEGKNVYRNYHGSRCAHAYIISNQFAHKVIDKIKYVNECADWFYNNLIKDNNLENYWFEPSLATQNTKYISAISGRCWTKDLLQ